MPALDRDQIQELIPHRDPFLFVDRVLEWSEGERLVAETAFAEDAPFFRGHFPGDPVVPGVLLIEAAAQASCVLTMLSSANRGRLFLFAAVDRFRFSSPVRPGETIRIEVEILRAESNGGIASVRLLEGERRVAKGRIAYGAAAGDD